MYTKQYWPVALDLLGSCLMDRFVHRFYKVCYNMRNFVTWFDGLAYR